MGFCQFCLIIILIICEHIDIFMVVGYCIKYNFFIYLNEYYVDE